MKTLLIRTFLLCLVGGFLSHARAEVGDTTRVVVMDKYLWTGHGHQDVWAQFPDSSKRYEKILLRYTLTCPSGGCGEWDYTTGIIVRHRTGSTGADSVVPFEITRYITPYGKAFPKDWTRTWTMDVTDFVTLLRDSVELRSYYDGYTPGSLYTLSFDFIEGTPVRETYKVVPNYSGYFTYGNPNDPIANKLPEITLPVVKGDNEMMTLRLIVSGHGSDQNGACEFIDATHGIHVNGAERYSQHLWRDDCGINYTYPQTGTYWFPRAGWCPGDLVFPWDYDLTQYIGGEDSVSFQYVMEDYTSPNPSGGYSVHGLVFYSKQSRGEYDAALTEIKKPTNEPKYSRTNPICNGESPVVVLSNHGTAVLTSAEITYGTNGNEDHTFTWTGLLHPYEQTDVSLPAFEFAAAPGVYTFSATVGQLNNENVDLYTNDNQVIAGFEMPGIFTERVALNLRIDSIPPIYNIPNAIRWELLDAVSGTLLKEGGNYEDAELVRDTFDLATGCYRFIIYDEGLGEGLMPWVTDSSKNGNYSLREARQGGKYIVNATTSSYRAEFGNREETTFSIGSLSSVAEQLRMNVDFAVAPNPGNGMVTLKLPEETLNELTTVSVYDMLGRSVISKMVSVGSPRELQLDLTDQASGSYIIRIESMTIRSSKGWIKQ